MSPDSPTSDRPPIIVTDSTCDLPAPVFEQYGIRVVPLKVLFGEETFLSNVDLDMDAFFERLKRGDVHPSTVPATVSEMKQWYETLGKDSSPILSIHVSAKLSETYNNARVAAKQFPDRTITVWDSKTVSGALGLQVLTAARAAKAGYTIEQITPLLDQTFEAGNLLFCIDDLSYLFRGGRIGRVSFYVAQTLRLKPIITISKSGELTGTYISTKDRVHSLSRANNAFMRQLCQSAKAKCQLRAITLHGDQPTPIIAAQLNEQLQDRFECVFLETAVTTPTLGVHTGPQVLAVAYAEGDWPV